MRLVSPKPTVNNHRHIDVDNIARFRVLSLGIPWQNNMVHADATGVFVAFSDRG
jgi:hypothetical protein